MKPYQISGLSFLVYLHRNGLSGILGDEMGLGKTLQTLSLIQYLKETRTLSGSHGERRPCLVICPLSVLSSWMSEARRWTPGLKVLRFHGPVVERNRVKKVATGEEDMYGNQTKHARRRQNERRTVVGKPVIVSLDSDAEDTDEDGIDLIVTTYDGFKSEESWFKRAFVWSYVVLDEGHKIKNDLSQVSKALQGLGAEYRLILTGTPLQNNMVELWALLRWLYPEVFVENTADLFKTSFNLSRGQVNTKVMDDARHLLELIMLRRMKDSPGVDLNLPPKTNVLLFVPLTPMQKFWYTRLLTRADQGLLEELFQGAKGKEAAILESENQTSEDKDLVGLEGFQSNQREAAAPNWIESKEIITKAIQQEQQEEGNKSAWKKLMNLLMQLRKVRVIVA
jgi:SWI/SNF-related matrix-associated actin-dependent regulator of chromatin subfamily A member 5